MKAIVLSSGGIDSTTCIGLAVEKYSAENVATVSIFYGQRHERELQSARAVAEYYGLAHHEFNAAALFRQSDSALLQHSARKVEHSSYAKQSAVNKKLATYVPFRNGLMLSMAASFADGFYEDEEPIELYLGVHADDAAVSAYPDCSAKFVKAIDHLRARSSDRAFRQIQQIESHRARNETRRPLQIDVELLRGRRGSVRQMRDVSRPRGGFCGKQHFRSGIETIIF